HVVAVARGGFPSERIAQAGAAAGFDADAEPALRNPVLGRHFPDELGGVFTDLQHGVTGWPVIPTIRVLFYRPSAFARKNSVLFSSVTREGGIYLVNPREDTAREVYRAGEAPPAQQLHRVGAA